MQIIDHTMHRDRKQKTRTTTAGQNSQLLCGWAAQAGGALHLVLSLYIIIDRSGGGGGGKGGSGAAQSTDWGRSKRTDGEVQVLMQNLDF